MTWLWKYEQLEELSHHDKSDVRAWAMEKLSLLYPEKAADAAVRLLDDASPGVVSCAVKYFTEQQYDFSYREKLLRRYETSDGRMADELEFILAKAQVSGLIEPVRKKYGMMDGRKADFAGYARALNNLALFQPELARPLVEQALKDALAAATVSSEAVGELFSAGLLSGIDIAVLLRLLHDNNDEQRFTLELFSAILSYCGCSIRPDQMDAECGEALANMEGYGMEQEAGRLRNLFDEGKYAEGLEYCSDGARLLLDTAKWKRGDTSYSAWERTPGTLSRCVAALAGFREAIREAREPFQKYTAQAGLIIFDILLDGRSLLGVSLEAMTARELLTLLMENRITMDEDASIIALLAAKTQDKAEIIEACIERMFEEEETWAAERSAQVIAALGDADDVARVLRETSLTEDDWQELMPAALKFGPAAVDIFKPLLLGANETKTDYALEALSFFPAESATDLLLDQWARLWLLRKHALLSAVEQIGDPRFIDPLQKELKEGEWREAKAYLLLCAVNRVDDPGVKKLEKAYGDYERKMAERVSRSAAEGLGTLLGEPVETELRCRSCGRTYHYAVRQIVIDPKFNDTVISDEIRCKNCMAFDNYEITPHGDLAIASAVFALNACMQQGNKTQPEATIVYAYAASIDGKQMSLADSLAHYDDKIERQPGSAEYRIGRANILRGLKRSVEAEGSYKAAVECDPLAVDGYLMLAQFADMRGDLKAARELFKKTADIFDRGHFYRVRHDKAWLKDQVLDSLANLERRLGLEPSARSNQLVPKTGRNDPCPCGSGKKYKKCCLMNSSSFELF